MYMPTTTTTTFLDTLNSLLPAPKSFHRIAYSDTANLPTYLTPTDPHDFAYDYEAGVLKVKTGGAWTTVDATKTFIFKEYTVNCVPPDPYYGIAYNGVPDIDWPPELHWGAIYVADSWTPILGSNAQTGELAVINEITYMLAMTPAGIKLNWAELDQSPTGSGGFVHENDPTINRPVLVTAMLTNPTLTDALMTGSTIENTLALTTTLDDPTILTGTLTGSTITSPIVSNGTFSNPTITTGTITDAETHNEMSYDATLFDAQITNGTLDTAILNSPALNTATIISSSLDDVIITSATISDSTVNGSNVNDAVINISSMSNSSIDHTSIDFATVNGSSINDAIISTSAISFTTITDATITDSTINNSVLNAPDLGTPISGDLVNCTFPIATDSDLGSVMVDDDSIKISGTGVISVSTTRANNWGATQSFSGSTSSLATLFTNTGEVVTVSNTAANNTVLFNVTSQAIMYYTANAAGNWIVNFRGSVSSTLNDVMSVGQCVTVSFLVTQGSTAYYNAAVQIDGFNVTPKYQGGTAITSGNANGIDMYTYTIIKTSATAFTVLMSLTNFG